MANKKDKDKAREPKGTIQEERLALRYPALKNVPPHERRPIVRAALLSPAILLFLFAVALIILPRYLEFAFTYLNIEQEQNMLFQLGKAGLVMLLPVCTLVPLLTRFLMPRGILKAMRKRGYGPDGK